MRIEIKGNKHPNLIHGENGTKNVVLEGNSFDNPTLALTLFH